MGEAVALPGLAVNLDLRGPILRKIETRWLKTVKNRGAFMARAYTGRSESSIIRVCRRFGGKPLTARDL